MRLLRRIPSGCNIRIMCSSNNSGYSGVMYITIIFLEKKDSKIVRFYTFSHLEQRGFYTLEDLKWDRVGSSHTHVKFVFYYLVKNNN